MNESTQRFISDITALSPGLADAHRQTIEYWLPDCPPATVAYAEIGHRIADDFGAVRQEINDAIFRLVEEGMASNDEELRTAVAAGLIEGLIGRAASVEETLIKILSRLGPLSKSHANAWLDVS